MPGLSPVELEILRLTTVLERSVYANDSYETLSQRPLELVDSRPPLVLLVPNRCVAGLRRCGRLRGALFEHLFNRWP